MPSNAAIRHSVLMPDDSHTPIADSEELPLPCKSQSLKSSLPKQRGDCKSIEILVSSTMARKD